MFKMGLFCLSHISSCSSECVQIDILYNILNRQLISGVEGCWGWELLDHVKWNIFFDNYVSKEIIFDPWLLGN